MGSASGKRLEAINSEVRALLREQSIIDKLNATLRDYCGVIQEGEEMTSVDAIAYLDSGRVRFEYKDMAHYGETVIKPEKCICYLNRSVLRRTDLDSKVLLRSTALHEFLHAVRWLLGQKKIIEAGSQLTSEQRKNLEDSPPIHDKTARGRIIRYFACETHCGESGVDLQIRFFDGPLMIINGILYKIVDVEPSLSNPRGGQAIMKQVNLASEEFKEFLFNGELPRRAVLVGKRRFKVNPGEEGMNGCCIGCRTWLFQPDESELNAMGKCGGVHKAYKPSANFE